MSKKNLKIIIDLEHNVNQYDLNLRNTISDTLEDRGIGEVWDEGSGENFLEINMELEGTGNIRKEVESILKSFGIQDASQIIIEDFDD